MTSLADDEEFNAIFRRPKEELLKKCEGAKESVIEKYITDYVNNFYTKSEFYKKYNKL
jgi:hypothetical protein